MKIVFADFISAVFHDNQKAVDFVNTLNKLVDDYATD